MKYLTEEQNARNVRDYRPIPLLIEAKVLTQKSREGAINIMDGVKKSKKPKYTPPLSANVFAENLQHANYIKDNIKKNRKIRGAYLTQYEKLYDDLIGKKQREIEEAQIQRSGDLYAEMLQAEEYSVREPERFMINPRRSQGQQVRRGRERNEKKERKTMSEEDIDADEGYSAPEVEMIRRINEL